MRKVLITGVTAFAGSHLADFLLDNDLAEVHGIRRPRSRDEFIRKEVIYHEADVTDYVGVSDIIKDLKPTYIFHLAAQSFVPLSWKAPAATLTTNILGTLTMLEAVKNLSPETIIQVACSSEEYGLVRENEVPIKESQPLRPLSPYGVSKVAVDLLAQQYNHSYGTHTIITRAFNHEGPRRGEVFVTSSFAKQIAEIEAGKREPVIRVGNLEAKRDFTDVRDMVKAYWLAVQGCKFGVPYNVCSETSISIQKMLDILLSFSKISVSTLEDKDRLRPSDVLVLEGDCKLFKSTTGWSPKISLERTLEDLLNYWRRAIC
jgi:GDP-4-dehydro-6-deoxy-D-mannose reductase